MSDTSDIQRWMTRPVTPGAFLRRLMAHLDVTQEALADALRTSRFTVSQIVTGRRSVTPAMALRLSKVTGTSIDIWLNLQRNIDLYDEYLDLAQELGDMKPIGGAPRPIRIFETVGGDTDILANAIVGTAFPSEDAPDRRSTIGLQMAVFGPDNLQHIFTTHGEECVRKIVEDFCRHVREACENAGLKPSHFSLETVLVSAQGGEPLADRLSRAFANVPTGLMHGRIEIKTTISGGTASGDGSRTETEVAERASAAMEALRRLRPGSRQHLWREASAD